MPAARLGAYSKAHAGCADCRQERRQYPFYRYHIDGPVYFRQDIRVTVQQIGFLRSVDGKPQIPVKGPLIRAAAGEQVIDLGKLPSNTLFEREDDWSCVAYFYLDRPGNGLPALAQARARTNRLQ